MVKNEDGLVKCLTPKGNVRWIIERDANDAMLLKSMDLVVAPSPVKLEPRMIIPVDEATEMTFEVAETVVADKPRKQKTK
jgi:hypothetical protein